MYTVSLVLRKFRDLYHKNWRSYPIYVLLLRTAKISRHR